AGALWKMIVEGPGRTWVLLLLVVGGLATFAVMAAAPPLAAGSIASPSRAPPQGAQQPRRVTPSGTAVLLAACALPFAALPNLWVYPFPRTLADVLLVTLVFLQLLVGAAAVLAARHVWSRRGRAAPR